MSNLVQKIQPHKTLYGNNFIIIKLHISGEFILRYYRRTNSAINYHFNKKMNLIEYIKFYKSRSIIYKDVYMLFTPSNSLIIWRYIKYPSTFLFFPHQIEYKYKIK